MQETKDLEIEIAIDEEAVNHNISDEFFRYMASELFNSHKEDLIAFYYNVIRKDNPFENKWHFHDQGDLRKIHITAINNQFQVYFIDMDHGQNFAIMSSYGIYPILSRVIPDYEKRVTDAWQDFLIEKFGDEYKQRLLKGLKDRLDTRQSDLNTKRISCENELKHIAFDQATLNEDYSKLHERFPEEFPDANEK